MPDVLYLSKPIEEIMETWLGDTVNFTVAVKDKDKQPIDLSDGWSAVMKCVDQDKKPLFEIEAEVIEDGDKFKFFKEDWDNNLSDGSYSYILVVTGPDGTYTIAYGEYQIH